MGKTVGYILEKNLDKERKLPTDIKRKIFFRMLIEYAVLLLVVIYIVYMYLGSKYVEQSVFEQFSRIYMCIVLVMAMLCFEISYRKSGMELEAEEIETRRIF